MMSSRSTPQFFIDRVVLSENLDLSVVFGACPGHLHSK